MSTINALSDLTGRVFLSALFVIAGAGKIAAFEGTQQYMEAMGVPGELLPVVIVLELFGGLAIAAGLATRWTAFILGGFTVLSALIFHADFNDQMQSILFMKNVAIAGGFGMLFIHGAGPWSLDALIAQRQEAN